MERNAAEQAEQARRDRAAAWLAAYMPPDGTAIVAACYHDESDAQTDYFGGRSGAPTIIAFSKHRRDLFPELRKAAAAFPATAHLGPGLDLWTVSLVWDHNSDDPARREASYFARNDYYCKGWQVSANLRDYTEWPGDSDAPQFPTKAQALAWIAQAPKWAGVEWSVDLHSFEHREKYSMGSGYYLSDGGAYRSGWRVRKCGYMRDLIDAVLAGRVAVPGLAVPPELTDLPRETPAEFATRPDPAATCEVPAALFLVEAEPVAALPVAVAWREPAGVTAAFLEANPFALG